MTSFLVMIPILSMLMQKTHFLNILLYLETFSITILSLSILTSKITSIGGHFLLVFMTFSACEAAMGLGLLVTILRTTGNDYVSSTHTLKF
uniref:NADH-ubiquinone oxidoreductase chain 4L n=1 Tax=Laevipilina antarctica TaxID=358449 RepID=A0A1L6BZY0_9MOLL|nr:NADH dehydrogenase subunit 4L [Laevipilina antarctica]APQ42961.1 NADH dehydrogenase subunit 4L [Laevipilina antarctica]